MRRNYQQKLLQEIITQNYQLVYYVAENVGIIGILAYIDKTNRIVNNTSKSYRIVLPRRGWPLAYNNSSLKPLLSDTQPVTRQPAC